MNRSRKATRAEVESALDSIEASRESVGVTRWAFIRSESTPPYMVLCGNRGPDFAVDVMLATFGGEALDLDGMSIEDGPDDRFLVLDAGSNLGRYILGWADPSALEQLVPVFKMSVHSRGELEDRGDLANLLRAWDAGNDSTFATMRQQRAESTGAFVADRRAKLRWRMLDTAD